MPSKFKQNIIKLILFFSLIFNSAILKAQNDSIPKSKSAFWQKVNVGGGLGLNVGGGFTNVSISPMLYYNVNEWVSFGAGLNGSYIKSRNDYNSWIYGGSVAGIFNPIENVQISTEFEQLRVNAEFESLSGNTTDNFWNSALFIGAGYRMGGVTLGLRYNVLHDANNFIYSDPLMPFVRVVF